MEARHSLLGRWKDTSDKLTQKSVVHSKIPTLLANFLDFQVSCHFLSVVFVVVGVFLFLFFYFYCLKIRLQEVKITEIPNIFGIFYMFAKHLLGLFLESELC